MLDRVLPYLHGYGLTTMELEVSEAPDTSATARFDLAAPPTPAGWTFYAWPEHPDETPRRGCSCLLDWARSMRRPASDIIWPGWRLTVSMVKPGSDPIPVRGLLAESHSVVEEIQRHLTPADVRRLYPDAYGRDYVTRRDDYLTSAPVTVFVLVASPSAIGKAKDIKADIRRLLGDGDALRNHLHMPRQPRRRLRRS